MTGCAGVKCVDERCKCEEALSGEDSWRQSTEISEKEAQMPADDMGHKTPKHDCSRLREAG